MTPAPAPLSRLRVLAWSLLVAPAAVLLAMWFVLADDGIDDPPAWSLVAVAGAGAAALATILTVGYRVPAIAPTLTREEIDTRAPALFTAGLVLRSALCELPLLAAIGLAFVVTDGGFLVTLLGGVITLPLMLWHVVPSESQISRVTAGLERNGAAVPLHAVLHGDPH